jgi:acyl-CoA synthetase (AMP-forming)/AMP-acid ligase II
MLVHHFPDYYSRNNSDAPSVTQAGTTWSYGDLTAAANRVANGLLELGVEKGRRVAVIGENSIEHLQILLAAGKIGAVAVPLNYRLAPAELSFIISDAKAKVLVVLEGMEQTLEALRSELPRDTVVITKGRADTLSWDTWVEQFPVQAPDVDVRPDDAFVQLYTSGTTGNPKGVVNSHFNFLSLALMNNIASPHRPSAGAAMIICAPLFHIGGTGSVVGAFFSGLHILLHQAFDPVQLVDDLEQHPVSTLFVVPAMIMAMLQIPGIETRDFSKLEQIFYGASPISETVLRRALEVFQCDFIQVYGMTETTGTVVSLSTEDHRRALESKPELLRSCGRPCVGAEAKVMDVDGNEVAVGEVGEIWLRSDTNMIGYYNQPDATAKTLTNGWVHSGDAGYMDTEGFLYLKDRIKDMVVSGAENIYPVEVENAIAQHEAVQDVAVIGVPDDKFGEALLAFVVTKSGAKLTIEQLIEFCRDKIAGYKIPRQMELVDELPRNPSGKILKKILRKPFWAGKDREIG